MNLKRALLPAAGLLLMAAADYDTPSVFNTYPDTSPTPLAATLRPSTATIYDGVPLMHGLQLVEDSNLVRLVPGKGKRPLIGVGLLNVDDVYKFYDKVLPSLGWTATGPRQYIRGMETLTIDAANANNGQTTTITFSEFP